MTHPSLRAGGWCRAVGVLAVACAARAAGAAELPVPEPGTPVPPLPWARLAAGDWARWDGEQLSRTELLDVSHTLTVKEKTADEIALEHYFRNHTRDRTPENERTLWNSLPDDRTERRFSLAAPPDAMVLFLGSFKGDAEGNDAADKTPPPVAPEIRKSSRETIEAAGKSRDAVFLAYPRPMDGEADAPAPEGVGAFAMMAREWRGDVPFGLLKLEFGLFADGPLELFADPEELEVFRRDAREAGLSEDEVAREVEAMSAVFRLVTDEAVPLEEVVAKALAVKTVQRELKKEGRGEKELAEELAKAREELSCAAEGMALGRWTLAAYGTAADAPK